MLVTLSDGVYFGVPDEVYHKIPRLSSSGVKDLMVSELDFWTKSWMNPENDKPREEDPRDTMFKLKGRAYHCRLLEGADEFGRRFAYSLDPADFGERTILYTTKDVERELRRLGLKGWSSFNKPDLIGLLMANMPEALIWDLLEAEYRRKCAGATIIPHEWMRDIEFGVAMIEKHPVLQHAIRGGFPEVTALWTAQVEDEDGSGRVYSVPMKARFDRLKPEVIVDYKTFSNPLRKKIPQAITSAMAAQKNHIQVAVYHDAADAVPALLGAGMAYFWDQGPCPIMDISRHPDVVALSAPDKKFFFLYQQTGAAPIAVGRIMPRKSNMVDIGRMEYRRAAVKFAKCTAHFGADPWIIPDEIEEFEDDQFPAWMAY